jgi:hypothetical protein
VQNIEDRSARVSFGYKTAWFAFRSAAPEAVIRALGLSSPVAAKAQVAIDAAYGNDSKGLSGKAFVTPPLSGWTLAMSTGFFDIADAAPALFPELLVKLSAELGTEVQFFATHRVVEAHLWARAIGGSLVRAYSYVGESGEKRVEIGEPTPEEVALDLRFFDPNSPDAEEDGYWEREDLRYPDEEDVMRVAERWSVNPSALTDVPEGFLADRLPRGGSSALRTDGSLPAQKNPWWRFW